MSAKKEDHTGELRKTTTEEMEQQTKLNGGRTKLREQTKAKITKTNHEINYKQKDKPRLY